MNKLAKATKKLAKGLEALHEERNNIPFIMDQTNMFLQKTLVKDLCDIGHKVKVLRCTKNPQYVLFSLFFPRTAEEFSSFDKEMNRVLEKRLEENQKKKERCRKNIKKNHFGIN